jgi:prepilin-type N-terminal cleavage/methylation domain-containing protein
MKHRSGFSLIELVLAIVIIAISVMTIPLMLSQSANSISFALTQDSILAARTKMGNILSYEWDANSSDSTGSDTVIRVLDVINGDADLNRTALYDVDINRRIGHVIEDKRRRMYEGNLTNKSFPSPDVNLATKTSINNFHNENVMMLSGSGLDYVRDFNMSTKIWYLNDGADYNATIINDFDFVVTAKSDITDINKSTNIKMIEIDVSSDDGQDFKFRAFSCNIGQSTLEERTP